MEGTWAQAPAAATRASSTSPLRCPMIVSKNTAGGLPGGPAVQDLSSHGGDARSVAGWGTKTPPCLTTRKPALSKDPSSQTNKHQSVILSSTRSRTRGLVLSPNRASRSVFLVSVEGHSIPPSGSAQRVIPGSSLFTPYLILQHILLVPPSGSVQNPTCFLVALATGLVEPPPVRSRVAPSLPSPQAPGTAPSSLSALAASWVCSSSLTLFLSLLRGHFLREGPSFLFKIATDPHPPNPS